MEHEVTLRIVVFQEGDIWVAQCIEHDLNGQGSSIVESVKSLARVITTRCELDTRAGAKPLSTAEPAPKRFQDMFEGARGGTLKANELPLSKQTPRAEIRVSA